MKTNKPKSPRLCPSSTLGRLAPILRKAKPAELAKIEEIACEAIFEGCIQIVPATKTETAFVQLIATAYDLAALQAALETHLGHRLGTVPAAVLS